MSARLGQLESSMKQVEAQVNQLSFNLEFALPNIMKLPDDLKEPIDGLKAGLRNFTQGLVDQLVGGQLVEVEGRR